MRAAIIRDGIVINVCEASDDWMQATGAIPCGDAGPGWQYIYGAFIRPADAEPLPMLPTAQEQLDALFEGGAALAEMKIRISNVRQKGKPNGTA